MGGKHKKKSRSSSSSSSSSSFSSSSSSSSSSSASSNESDHNKNHRRKSLHHLHHHHQQQKQSPKKQQKIEILDDYNIPSNRASRRSLNLRSSLVMTNSGGTSNQIQLRHMQHQQSSSLNRNDVFHKKPSTQSPTQFHQPQRRSIAQHGSMRGINEIAQLNRRFTGSPNRGGDITVPVNTVRNRDSFSKKRAEDYDGVTSGELINQKNFFPSDSRLSSSYLAETTASPANKSPLSKFAKRSSQVQVQAFSSINSKPLNGLTPVGSHINDFSFPAATGNKSSTSFTVGIAKISPITNLLEDDHHPSSDPDIQKLQKRNEMLQKNQTQQETALESVKKSLRRRGKEFTIEGFRQARSDEKSSSQNIIFTTPASTSSSSFTDRMSRALSKIFDAFHKKHFLAEAAQETSYQLGLKQLFHFKFIATYASLALFQTLLFLFPIVKTATSSSSSVTGLGSFSIHLVNGQLGYLTGVFVISSLVLITIGYFKFIAYKKRDLSATLLESRGVKYLQMIVCEYNWKLKSIQSVRTFQLSLVYQVQSLLRKDLQEATKSTNQPHHHLQRRTHATNKQTPLEWQSLFSAFLFVIAYLLLLFASFAFQIFLINDQLVPRMLTANTFINEFMLSASSVVVIQLSCFLLLRLYETSWVDGGASASSIYLSQQKCRFYFELLTLSFYAFLRTANTLDTSNYQSNILLSHIDSAFIPYGYECPQQSSQESLISLYLAHAIIGILLKQYIPLIRVWLHRRHWVRQESEKELNYDVKQYRVIENTSPIVISFFLLYTASLYNVIAFPLGFLLSVAYFYHNLAIVQARRLPESLLVTPAKTQGVLVNMFIAAVIAIFVLSSFALTLERQAYKYTVASSGQVNYCGPFESSNTTSSLLQFFETIGNYKVIKLIVDIILWRPLILTLIVVLSLKTLANRSQQTKWKSEFSKINHEVHSIKQHYKKKTAKLQAQLHATANGIDQIQKAAKKKVISAAAAAVVAPMPPSYGFVTPNNEKYHLAMRKSLAKSQLTPQPSKSAEIMLTTEANEEDHIFENFHHKPVLLKL